MKEYLWKICLYEWVHGIECFLLEARFVISFGNEIATLFMKYSITNVAYSGMQSGGANGATTPGIQSRGASKELNYNN